MARIYRQIEAEARSEGDKRAREIITESHPTRGFRPGCPDHFFYSVITERRDERQDRWKERAQHPCF